MKNWIIGARPKTLLLSIIPILLSSAIFVKEQNVFFIGRFLLLILLSVALQVSVNYANDYADGIKGTDKDRVGPTRLVASGLKSAKSVKYAAIISTLVAVIAGIALCAISSWWLLIVGVFAVLATWGYTNTKWAYGYWGGGELFVVIFFGIIPCLGTYVVYAKAIANLSIYKTDVLLLGFICGINAALVVLLNNIRDIETDKKSNKKTLAVRIGFKNAMLIYWISFIAVAFLTILLSFTYIFSMCSLAALIFIINLIKYSKEKDFKNLFLKTIVYINVYSLLLFLGILFS